MRFSKLIIMVILLTLFSLFYVYQQTRIYALAYTGQKRMSEFQDSLDKNTLLRYNISKKVSLVNIGNKIGDTKGSFNMPATCRLVKVSNAPKLVQAPKEQNKENIFVRIFGVKKLAQAQTINR